MRKKRRQIYVRKGRRLTQKQKRVNAIFREWEQSEPTKSPNPHDRCIHCGEVWNK